MGGSTVTRFVRAMMSWTLLAAMLVSLPVGATGHFVCTLGMAEAGPACPLCHGHASAEQPGGGIANACCKFVGGQSSMDSRLVAAPALGPVHAQAQLLPAGAGLGLPAPPDRDLAVRVHHCRTPRTPVSGYLSNFLRL